VNPHDGNFTAAIMKRFKRTDLLDQLLRRSRRSPQDDDEGSVPAGRPPAPKPIAGGSEVPVD